MATRKREAAPPVQIAELEKSLAEAGDKVLMLIRRGEATLYVPMKRTG